MALPRFAITPDQLNQFTADDWAQTQTNKLADDWAAQAMAKLQAPTSSDSLTNPLGTAGTAPLAPGAPELPEQAPPEPVAIPEPFQAAPASNSPQVQSGGSSSPPAVLPPTPIAPLVAPPTMAPPPQGPDETISNPFGEAFRQVGNVVSGAAGAVSQATGIGQPAPPPPAPAVANPPTSVGSTSATPMPTGDLVDYARQAAQKAGIDPDLFVRQINQESHFDPTAGSPAGARGIAQIVPKYHPGVDVTDPFASLDYAARLMKSHLDEYGGDIRKALVAYNGGGGAVQAMDAGHIYEESRNYLDRILGGSEPTPTGGGQAAASVPGDVSLSQFGDKTLTADEAYAACGPAAASRLAASYGNNIPLSVALAAAKQVGWTSGAGMAGISSEKRLMDALGLPAELDTSGNTDRILSEAGAGKMVTISTPGHYFSASGTRQRADGQTELYVGQSGADLKAGKPWMTLGEIESVMGKIGGALFSDPSKAVAAGEFIQNASAQHGSPLEQPQDALDQLVAAKQKVTPPGPDETVSNPFGEALRQVGDVAGAVGGQVADTLSGAGQAVAQWGSPQPMAASQQATPSDTLTNPTLQTGPLASTEVQPTQPSVFEGPAQSDIPGVAGARNLALNVATSGVADLAGISPKSITQRDTDTARADAIMAAANAAKQAGQPSPTSAQDAEWLKNYVLEQGRMVGSMGMNGPEGHLTDDAGKALTPMGEQAANMAGRTLEGGAGALGLGRVAGDIAPIVNEGPVRAPLSLEQQQTLYEDLGQQWEKLGRQAQAAEDAGSNAFNPGLKARYQNEANAFRAQQDVVQAQGDHLMEHGNLPPETGPIGALPDQAPRPVNGAAEPPPNGAVPESPAAANGHVSSPSAVSQSAILSSPNYRRLQAMRGTADEAAQLRPAEKGFAGNINLEKITPDEVKAALQRTMDSPSTNEFAGQRRGVITDTAAQENAAAKALTMAPQDWIKTKAGRAFNQEEALALGNQMVRTGNEYGAMRTELQAAEKAGTATDLQRATVADKSLEFALLEGVRSGAAAEAGRALRSFRVVMDGAMRTGGDTSKALRSALKAIGGEDAYAEWAQKWSALDPADTVGKYRMLQALHQPSRMTKLVAWTTSNMLSGSKTLEVNLTGGAIETLNRPAIELLGGRPMDAMTDIAAMGRAFGEAWGNASTAFKTGVRPSQAARSMADPAKYDAVRPEAFSGNKLLGVSTGKVDAGIIATPALRVMSATDEFMRTLNAAGALAVAARREARATGKTVQTILSEPPDHVLKFAQDAADKAIFEGPGSPVSAAIIKWRTLINSSNPTERAIGVGANVLFPFVHIPEQILIRGTKMLPGVAELDLALTMRKAQKAGNTQAMRDAVGKYVMTESVLLAAGGLAVAGNLTGTGPKDAGKRSALDAARNADGSKVWQAHSIKVGDRWIDYTNLGPVAIPLAVVSNAHEAYLDSGKKPGASEVADVFNKVAATMMDATYIKSFGDLMKGVSEGRLDKAGASLIANTATRGIPFSGMLAQITRSTDQETKDPKSLPEYMASRVPGASNLVADKASPFGGPVQQSQDLVASLSPFKTTASGVPDLVAKAFVGVGMGSPDAPSTISVTNLMTGNTSPAMLLNEKEKTRYVEIMGQRLKERLTPITADPNWDKRTPESRKKALETQLTAARDYAKGQIYASMPPADRQARMAEGRSSKVPVPTR